jgi:predicted Holliday junction resolvase-like endonuclease
MLEILIPLAGIILGFLLVRQELRRINKVTPQTPIINVDLGPIHKALDQVPQRVLTAVTSSTNNLKGNLGELIGFLKLNAQYDRVIPLGNIVDFICISLPKDGKPGHIDFVDIKTGGSAKLSRDQVQLKKLIEEKKINFIKFKIEASTEPSDTL